MDRYVLKAGANGFTSLDTNPVTRKIGAQLGSSHFKKDREKFLHVQNTVTEIMRGFFKNGDS